jgi:hypothetical protein
MVTRSDLEATTAYRRLSALDKLAVERQYNIGSSSLQRKLTPICAIAATIAMPVSLYYLSQQGIAAPDPGLGRYALAGFTGSVMGFAFGMSASVLAYETFSPNGELRQFLKR